MKPVTQYAPVTRCREKRVVRPCDDELGVGQIRRQERLGSECLYRVCGLEGALVIVEVIRAPGLVAGQRFKFTRGAVARMQCVEPHDERPTTDTPAAR